ncbi:MAG TPA: hypothetical protein VK866_14595 [Acidimicrobiales bacterium]|nr:hypothetical protein [Acidimicrobiales bacterium]
MRPVRTLQRSSEEFCDQCDFPLFWADSAGAQLDPSQVDVADTTLRRLPGAEGRFAEATEVCPTCGELNFLGVTHCVRCGGPMELPYEPPPAPPEPPAPPPPPEPAVAAPPLSWIWWVIVAVLVVAFTAAVVGAIIG